MSELIPISALVGDRTFRVKIETADEEVVRKTLKTINDKVVEFKTLFAGKDMQDYISMVILWYATQQQNAQELDSAKTLGDSLNKIETLLDKTIGQ